MSLGMELASDVAVCFTEEEWALLDPGQRALHKEVTVAALETLASLRKAVSFSFVTEGILCPSPPSYLVLGPGYLGERLQLNGLLCTTEQNMGGSAHCWYTPSARNLGCLGLDCWYSLTSRTTKRPSLA
uniref:KRAB domain-containing protein n=1 Tax=Salvator merianae TaxID=96440 RepID=A0A8D0KMF2_SALMN